MSPRAACRLETLGFERVHDYAGGKADWMAAGLPLEGETQGVPPLMHLLRTDVETCGLGDRAGDVADRLRGSDGVGFAIVVDDARHVLGKVRLRDLERLDGEAAVDEVMVEGPTSTRADSDPHEMAHRMDHAGTTTVLVTTGQGELLGLLVRDDIDHARDASHG